MPRRAHAGHTGGTLGASYTKETAGEFPLSPAATALGVELDHAGVGLGHA